MDYLAKIVVIYNDGLKDKTLMIEFNQNISLANNIENICHAFKMSNPDKHGLKISESDCYVTEANRQEIRNGHFLRLVKSARKQAADSCSMIINGTLMEKTNALSQLAKLTLDIGFTDEFLRMRNAIQPLTNIVSAGRAGNTLIYSLTTISNLFKSSLIDFEDFDEKFVDRLLYFMKDDTCKDDVLSQTISVLVPIIKSDNSNVGIIQKTLEFNELSFLLTNKKKSNEIKFQLITLINALFTKASNDDKHQWSNILKNYKSDIYELVQSNEFKMFESFPIEMANLQANYFYHLKETRNNLQVNLKKVQDVFSRMSIITFNVEKKEFFDHLKFDTQDLSLPFKKPPGKLTLNCFSHLGKEQILKILRFNLNVPIDSQFPFGNASIKLVEILYEIFNVEKTNDPEYILYCPMVYTNYYSFERIFVLCLGAFLDIWKEMKAKLGDLDVIVRVLQQKILMGLRNKPSTFKEFQKYLDRINVKSVRESMHLLNDLKNSAPIKDLKDRKFHSTVNDLIKAKRLRTLVKGTNFPSYKKGIRESKFICIRLSKDHKRILYDDCVEGTSVLDEDDLSNSIEVNLITQILVGPECPHYKEFKPKLEPDCFSIGYDALKGAQSLNIVAPDEEAFYSWTDGMSALIGREMKSDQYIEDYEKLINLEVEMQLLNFENFMLEKEPPAIPNDPLNYDFGDY